MSILDQQASGQAPNTPAGAPVGQALPMGQPDPAAAAPPQQGQTGPAGMSGAEAGEQDAYDKVVLAGIQVMNTDPIHEQIMGMVADESSGEPAKRLARAASTVVSKLDEDSKGTLPEIVILPAAAEILEHVAEFANSSGALKVDENMMGKAGQFLLTDMADVYGISDADIQEVMAGVTPEMAEEVVKQQSAYDSSGSDAASAGPAAAPAATPTATPSAPPAPAAPQQGLPSIINSTVG